MVNESTISDLKAAIKRLEVEKERIEEQRRALVTTLAYFEGHEGETQPPMALPSAPIPTQIHLESAEEVSGAQRQRAASDLRDAMAEILADEGPLHRREVYDRLVERGVYVGGQDPVNNVGAHMSIDSRFVNVGRGLWDLAASHESDDEDMDDGDDSEEEEDRVPW